MKKSDYIAIAKRFEAWMPTRQDLRAKSIKYMITHVDDDGTMDPTIDTAEYASFSAEHYPEISSFEADQILYAHMLAAGVPHPIECEYKGIAERHVWYTVRLED